MEKVSEMWKARGELTGVGWSPFINPVETCEYCQEKTRPDVVHMMGKCEALTEIRIRVFGEKECKVEEIRELVNCRTDEVIRFVYELKLFDAERQKYLNE